MNPDSIAAQDSDPAAVGRAKEEARALATHRLCRTMLGRELTSQERAAARRLVNDLSRDGSELVRRALAVTLRASDIPPREVVLRLVADVETVAVPLLQFSPVLTDQDLISAVRAGRLRGQLAVAQRHGLNRDVCELIAEEAGVEVVRLLADNSAADVSEWAMQRMIARFGRDAVVVRHLSQRAALPPAIIEALLERAGAPVRERLVQNHRQPLKNTLRLPDVREDGDPLDVAAGRDPRDVALGLYARRALTASVLMRALLRAEIAIFEHGLAVRAAVPHARTRAILHDAGALGLRTIYDRAGLPPRLFSSLRTALDIWRDLSEAGLDPNDGQFRQRLLQRFLSGPHGLGRADTDYLMQRLESAGADRVRLARAA